MHKDNNKTRGEARLRKVQLKRHELWYVKFRALLGLDSSTFVLNRGLILSDTGFRPNKLTNASLAVFSGLAGATGSQTAFTFIGVGSSSTAVSAGHTTLQAEISTNGLSRAAATVTRSTTTQTNDTLQLDKTFTASGSSTIEEIGVFNASSSGVMAGRCLTGTIGVSNTVLLVCTYKIIFVGN